MLALQFAQNKNKENIEAPNYSHFDTWPEVYHKGQSQRAVYACGEHAHDITASWGKYLKVEWHFNDYYSVELYCICGTPGEIIWMAMNMIYESITSNHVSQKKANTGITGVYSVGCSDDSLAKITDVLVTKLTYHGKIKVCQNTPQCYTESDMEHIFLHLL